MDIDRSRPDLTSCLVSSVLYASRNWASSTKSPGTDPSIPKMYHNRSLRVYWLLGSGDMTLDATQSKTTRKCSRIWLRVSHLPIPTSHPVMSTSHGLLMICWAPRSEARRSNLMGIGIEIRTWYYELVLYIASIQSVQSV